MSCATSPQPLEVQVQPIQIKRIIHPRPVGVPAPDIDMVVITPEIMAQWLAEIESGERQAEAYWSFNENNYLTLAQWLQDMLRFTKAQNALVKTYEAEARHHNQLQITDQKK